MIAPGAWRVAETAARADQAERDRELRSAVEQALWNDDVLRSVDLPVVEVAVEDETLTLRGHVVSPEHRMRAERAVRQVPGVHAVHNALVTNAELEMAVAQALARDPRTQHQPIRVRAFQGTVELLGTLASAQVRLAAEEVAASLPSVRSVVTHLNGVDTLGFAGRTAGSPTTPLILPRIGTGVHATDGELGRLRLVVIDPHSRQVTHLVVADCFPQNRAVAPMPDAALPGKSLVVPASAVERVTHSGIFLRVNLFQARRFSVYQDGDYRKPDSGWQPPLEYSWADTRFASEAR